jgi:hypothetical protein
MGFDHEVTLANEDMGSFEETPSLKKPALQSEETPAGLSKKCKFLAAALAVAVFCFVAIAVTVSLAVGLTLGHGSSGSSSSSSEIELGPGDCLTDHDCPTHDSCLSPSDCSDWGFEYGRCDAEECNSTADCSSGEICMQLNVNKCIPAPCISDFDCAHGHCVLYVAPSCSPAQSQMYCESSDNQCHHDDECEGLYRRCVAGECTRVF